MVGVMNAVTEEPAWQVNIFNDQIVACWREGAFTMTPLITEKAWELCIAELRDKAVHFDKNQHVSVLDTGSCICKSDTLVPESLSEYIRARAVPLLEQLEKDKDC